MAGAHLWEELRPVNSVWNETHACVCKHLQFWPWCHQNGDCRIWDLHRICPRLCNLGPSHFWIQCIKTQKGLVPNMQVYDLKFHQILIFKSDFVLISLNWKVKLRSFSARHHHCTWTTQWCSNWRQPHCKNRFVKYGRAYFINKRSWISLAYDALEMTPFIQIAIQIAFDSPAE